MPSKLLDYCCTFHSPSTEKPNLWGHEHRHLPWFLFGLSSTFDSSWVWCLQLPLPTLKTKNYDAQRCRIGHHFGKALNHLSTMKSSLSHHLSRTSWFPGYNLFKKWKLRDWSTKTKLKTSEMTLKLHTSPTITSRKFLLRMVNTAYKVLLISESVQVICFSNCIAIEYHRGRACLPLLQHRCPVTSKTVCTTLWAT